MLKKILNKLFNTDFIINKIDPPFVYDNETNFTVSKKDQDKVNKWLKRHGCSKAKVSRYVVYEFISNGIGTGINAKCSICGSRKDLTNYDNW